MAFKKTKIIGTGLAYAAIAAVMYGGYRIAERFYPLLAADADGPLDIVIAVCFTAFIALSVMKIWLEWLTKSIEWLLKKLKRG